MSASVVEVLGAAFGCYPHLFENHMRTIGGRPQQKIDENGAPLPINRAEPLYFYPELPRSSSELRDQPYFSVTFRRHFLYVSDQDREVHLRRRTMFRLFHEDEAVLEERVSGALHSTSAGTSKIGIFLFDSVSGSHPGSVVSFVNRQFSNTLPRFSTDEEIVLPLYGSDHSLRGAFLHQFQDSRFLEAILEDNSALLWAILKANFGAWRHTVGWWDNFSRLRRDDGAYIDDNRFLWHLMDQNGLRLENLEMLKHSLKVLQFGGCDMLRAQQGTQAHKVMTGLTIDYEELVKRTEGQIVGIQHRLSTLAAIRSITESEKSIKQSEKIGSLTTLATFFIPLSFVSSLLGMNVMEISSQKTSIWVFFAISIPLTLLAFIVLANWESLKEALMYLFAKRSYRYARPRRERWKGLLRQGVQYL
ncbi:hypothetical protein V8E51_012781 [Hyaloscypha variabilis]